MMRGIMGFEMLHIYVCIFMYIYRYVHMYMHKPIIRSICSSQVKALSEKARGGIDHERATLVRAYRDALQSKHILA